MSFKRLGDRIRRQALRPLLTTADCLLGHLTVFLVHRELRYLASNPLAFETWKAGQGLQGRWRPEAFEQLTRAAHLYSLLVSTFSRPDQNVTWITDEDQIVANDDRLTDALILTAKLTGLYCGHKLGELAMNSTAADTEGTRFEDFVAFSDLAAGAFGEFISRLQVEQPEWVRDPSQQVEMPEVSQKAQEIINWFSHADKGLRCTVFLVNRRGDGTFFVASLGVTP